MKKQWITGLCIALIVLACLAVMVNKVNAQTPQPTPAGTTGDQACLACHGKPGLETKLASGEILYLSIDSQTYAHSVHGDKGYACTQCHTDISGYPHPVLQAATRRDVTLQFTQVCAQCHKAQVDAAVNDAHTEARQAGNKQAAVCTDCHGTHDITTLASPRSRIPQTCEKCHSQIFDLYKNSVHGAALIGQGNPDVPSCVDCHNAHNVQGPVNTQFRLFSPQICARCHANKTLMTKYGINTNVFNTYIADFHGTTVEMFQAVAPGQETNKPVCIDCHGVHDIKNVNDPSSTVIKDHLLVTCQKCHPGASPNFPSAWLSHYQPSPQHYPIVYYVGIFYRFFIPGVLGVMGVFVVSDAGRRLFNKSRKKGKKSPDKPQPGPEKTQEAGPESSPDRMTGAGPEDSFISKAENETEGSPEIVETKPENGSEARTDADTEDHPQVDPGTKTDGSEEQQNG